MVLESPNCRKAPRLSTPTPRFRSGPSPQPPEAVSPQWTHRGLWCLEAACHTRNDIHHSYIQHTPTHTYPYIYIYICRNMINEYGYGSKPMAEYLDCDDDDDDDDDDDGWRCAFLEAESTLFSFLGLRPASAALNPISSRLWSVAFHPSSPRTGTRISPTNIGIWATRMVVWWGYDLNVNGIWMGYNDKVFLKNGKRMAYWLMPSSNQP